MEKFKEGNQEKKRKNILKRVGNWGGKRRKKKTKKDQRILLAKNRIKGRKKIRKKTLGNQGKNERKEIQWKRGWGY